ncbi:hypothetical protein EON66_03505 [archaeon]|nr:MAG: hypothetical protein EON66_03505 [archaeon]
MREHERLDALCVCARTRARAHAVKVQGTDLVYVACTSSASTPIKSYSPELIVHPLLPARYGFVATSHLVFA